MSEALLLSTKRREVWMHEHVRKIDRLVVLFRSAQVILEMRCKVVTCPDPQIRLVRDATDPGGRMLECGCTRRVLERKRHA